MRFDQYLAEASNSYIKTAMPSNGTGDAEIKQIDEKAKERKKKEKLSSFSSISNNILKSLDSET